MANLTPIILMSVGIIMAEINVIIKEPIDSNWQMINTFGAYLIIMAIIWQAILILSACLVDKEKEDK